MKTKGLLFISCLATGALIASPSFGKPAKKSAGMSQSKAKRVAPHTTQMMRNDRHNQNISPHTGGRATTATRYSGTRSYADQRSSGTRYYGGATLLRQLLWWRPPLLLWRRFFTPITATIRARVLNWGYGAYLGIVPILGLWGRLSVTQVTTTTTRTTRPTYGYNGSMAAAVQRRLGQLGYYHGLVDGVIGPQTSGAIAAFESRNGLAVDGTISRPLLDSLGPPLVGTNNQVFDRRRRTTKRATRRSFLFHHNQQMHPARRVFSPVAKKILQLDEILGV